MRMMKIVQIPWWDVRWESVENKEVWQKWLKNGWEPFAVTGNMIYFRAFITKEVVRKSEAEG